MRVSIWVLAAALSVGIARAQVLEERSFKTSGHPMQAMVTPDGKYLLVTVTGRDAGIDVFGLADGQLTKVAHQVVGPGGGGDLAQGIMLIPQSRVLAVGMSGAGVAFLPLDDVLTGKAKVQQMLSQGGESGTSYVVATPDGEYLFVANEYGARGSIGVVAVHRDEAGGVHPETVAEILTPNTTPGVAISPDGTRVYAVAEVTRPEVAARMAGHGVKELERDGCTQANPQRRMPNGLLYTIDVARVRLLTRASTPEEVRRVIVGIEDAGCSPVRAAVTADGGSVYVTARGDNRVLVFDAKKLVSDAYHAFVGAIESGGGAPVGLGLFDGGKGLVVANSNRFSGGSGNATVFSVGDGGKAEKQQTIKTGEFPRNITVSGDLVVLTVFSGDQVVVLRKK